MQLRIHVPGLYHTVVSQAYSHCAFTSNLLRFAKMMCARGAEVVEYGNEGSESAATEHVVLRSRERFDELHLRPAVTTVEKDPGSGSASHLSFLKRLREELTARARPGDFFVHPYGPVYQDLVKEFPQLIHVEPFIGYTSGPFGAYRGFVTETWRHWHFGRYDFDDVNTKQRVESWVLPMFYDAKDWPLSHAEGGYFAFMARKCTAKGLKVLAEIVRRYQGPRQFRIAGPGEEWVDWQQFVAAVPPALWESGDVRNCGVLKSEERAQFLGGAAALLCPSQYVEPGGGVVIESHLCGTPALGSDWGCFTETVPSWARCRTVDDWLRAMHKIDTDWYDCDRAALHYDTKDVHSLEAAGRRYVRVFEQIRAMHAR